MTTRAKPTEFWLVMQSPLASVHAHGADRPVKDMLAPDYLMNVRGNLRAGDVVWLHRIRNERLREFAAIRIVEVHPDRIEFAVEGDIVDYGEQPKPEKPEPGPAEIYVENDNYTVKNMGAAGGWSVIDPDGNVVANKLSEEDARAIRAGGLPIPQTAKAA